MLINKNRQQPKDAAQNETIAQEPEAQETAKPEATKAEEKAVAPRQTTAVSADSFQGIWYTNPVIAEVVASAEYGDFPQIVAEQGGFKEAGTNKQVGKMIEFVAIQAKMKKVCSPGSNDEESKEFFAAAYEGELAHNGLSIEECVQLAKEAGYERAEVKTYADLFVRVMANADDKNDLTGEVVSLQLGPMSLIEWRKFSKRLEMKAAFGELKMDEGTKPIIRATATIGTNKANKSYTYYKFDLLSELSK